VDYPLPLIPVDYPLPMIPVDYSNS